MRPIPAMLTVLSPVHEDPQPSTDEQVEELEFENDQLRSKITALERELNCRSPSKKSKSKKTALETSRNANFLGRESDIEVALRKMDHLKLADSMFKGSPAADSPGRSRGKFQLENGTLHRRTTSKNSGRVGQLLT